MSNKKYGLTETEYELMEYFWSKNEKVTFKELLEYFNKEKDKNWKKQTLSTFLKILNEHGLIAIDTTHYRYSYYALISRDELIYKYTHRLVEESYGNSLGTFLSAFTGGKKLKRKEAEELRNYLDGFMDE